jgi:hypothetical protein
MTLYFQFSFRTVLGYACLPELGNDFPGGSGSVDERGGFQDF